MKICIMKATQLQEEKKKKSVVFHYSAAAKHFTPLEGSLNAFFPFIFCDKVVIFTNNDLVVAMRNQQRCCQCWWEQGKGEEGEGGH